MTRLSPPEHERLIGALEVQWMMLNETVFGKRVSWPAFRVEDTDVLETYLPWDDAWEALPTTAAHETYRGRITLSLSLCIDHPWHSVVEVLKRAMVRQFVDESSGNSLRNKSAEERQETFRAACAFFGVHTLTGIPTLRMDRTPEEDRLIDRVVKLLALARSSNENEAQAAAAAARRLMLKHDIDERQANRERHYGRRHLGSPAMRHAEWTSRLGGILESFFMVRTIWVETYLVHKGRWGRVLEVIGTRANLDMAEYVYAFLRDTGHRLFEERSKKNVIAKGARARDAFLAGVMLGFSTRLAREAATGQVTGLVWTGDASLDAYFAKEHPRVVTSGRHGGTANTAAKSLGFMDGQDLVLHKPLGDGDASSRGLLLGAKT